MTVHEMADRAGERQHHAQRDDHRGDHHPELVRHAHRRDHRVERENDVEEQNLHDRPAERGDLATARRMAVGAFELLVNFHDALADQEQTAHQQNQALARDRHLEHGQREQHLRQAHHPGDRAQQNHPRDQRQTEAELPRLVLLRQRQFARQDRNEDHIVDAEHDLQRREREERNPNLRISEPVHGAGDSGAPRAGVNALARNSRLLPRRPLPGHREHPALSTPTPKPCPC